MDNDNENEFMDAGGTLEDDFITDTPASPSFEDSAEPGYASNPGDINALHAASVHEKENNALVQNPDEMDDDDDPEIMSEHSSDYERNSSSSEESEINTAPQVNSPRREVENFSFASNRIAVDENVSISPVSSLEKEFSASLNDQKNDDSEQNSRSTEQYNDETTDSKIDSEDTVENNLSPNFQESKDTSTLVHQDNGSCSQKDVENFPQANDEVLENYEHDEQESAMSPEENTVDSGPIDPLPATVVSPKNEDMQAKSLKEPDLTTAELPPLSDSNADNDDSTNVEFQIQSDTSPVNEDSAKTEYPSQSAASPENVDCYEDIAQAGTAHSLPDVRNLESESNPNPESPTDQSITDSNSVSDAMDVKHPEVSTHNDSASSSQSANDLDRAEDEIRRLKAQIAAVDEEEEGEDLEEGEIEDDEESPPAVVVPKTVPTVVVSTDTKDKDKDKASSHKHRHSSSSKDKDSRSKTKEKESSSKSDRRRKHSVESKDGPSEKSSKDKEKSSKKRTRRSEDVSAGDEDYLFVRGASPSSPTVGASLAASPGSGGGRKIYDTDPFGNPIYEDELENDFPLSPEAKRRRKSRSPPGGSERRRREESRGSRRPNSGRKDTVKPLHKSDQICAYYMQGKCQKSHEDCAFSHNAVPPRKMELCKFWMLDCCAKKEKCLYLHNDFPCKYYHTGLVCKMAQKNQCKFSHKPMNEVTKAVLLKHIETAPKEILGDFPRLNRQGALNLIAKMESRINGELKKQERERDEERRRTRWEQPTKDDENKLQELMEEAGLGNYYQETVEGAPQKDKSENSNSRDRDHRKLHGSSQGGIAPLMGILPNQLPPPMLPPQPHIVNNPALANVLASLHIPSTTIQRPPGVDGKENQKETKSSRSDEHYSRESRISPDSPPHQPSFKMEPKEEDEPNLPDNLPPMQRGIFRRLQEQQLKNELKIKEEPSDDEKPDDRGWYSSDEEGDKPLTDVLKEIPTKNEPEKMPVVDFASVLSAIRKTTAAVSNHSEPEAKRSKFSTSPPLPAFPGRGDVDFRFASGVAGLPPIVNDQPSSSQGPFRDTDFRVPIAQRQEFRDVDLRMTDLPLGKKSPVPVFKPLPTGPATMIDAAINSHPPMPWRVRIVADVKSPDYNYIKHTLTPAQLALDPRFGPRTAGGISLLPDPASPPQNSQSVIGGNSPANIPGGDVVDPRMNRRGAGAQSADPRLGSDPRASGTQGQIPPTLLPPGWPGSVDMTQAQAALAAQFIAAQQLGLLPFPNPGGMPMIPPSFGDMNGRPAFPSNVGRGSGPPASSWERYSQQQSGGVTPPL